MKTILLTLLMFSVSINMQASSSIDSLFLGLDTSVVKEERIDIFKKIVDHYYNSGNCDSLVLSADNFIKELDREDLKKNRFLYVKKISCQIKLFALEEALETANEFELLCEEGNKEYYKDLFLIERVRFYFAYAHEDYKKASASLNKGLDLATKASDSKSLMFIYGDLALFYATTEDFKAALISEKKALKIAEERLEQSPNEFSALINCISALNGIAVSHEELSEFDSSRVYLQKGIDITEQHSFLKEEEAKLKANLARTLGKDKDIEASIALANESISLSQKLDIPLEESSIFIAYLALAEGLFVKGSINAAREAILKSIQYSGGDLTNISAQIYKLAFEIDKEHNPKQALKYHEKYVDIREVMYKKNNKNDLIRKELALQFEAERKEYTLQKKLQQEKIYRQRLSLFLGSVVVGLLGLVTILFYTFYRKQQKINRELTKTKNKLLLTNRRLGRFVHSVSHDILNKLDYVVLSGNHLVEDSVNKKYQEYYEESKSTAFWLKNYCLDLLNWAESDVDQTQDTLTNVQFLVEDIFSTYEHDLKKYQFDLDIRDLPKVSMPEAPLKQVLQNLIDNAIKYSKNKTSPKIKIATLESKDGLAIMIKDNGKGINAKKQKSIFKPTKDKSVMHGRGLSYIHDILTEQDENIWVDNNDWGGTSFFFTLK